MKNLNREASKSENVLKRLVRISKSRITQNTRQFVGRGGALVESIPFNRRVVGSNPALAATQGPWASPRSCLWRFGVKLWQSIRAVSGARLSNSGLEEAL